MIYDTEDKIAQLINGMDLAQRARDINFPLGESIFYVDKDNWFIEEKPDGTIVKIKEMEPLVEIDKLKFTLK